MPTVPVDQSTYTGVDRYAYTPTSTEETAWHRTWLNPQLAAIKSSPFISYTAGQLGNLFHWVDNQHVFWLRTITHSWHFYIQQSHWFPCFFVVLWDLVFWQGKSKKESSQAWTTYFHYLCTANIMFIICVTILYLDIKSILYCLVYILAYARLWGNSKPTSHSDRFAVVFKTKGRWQGRWLWNKILNLQKLTTTTTSKIKFSGKHWDELLKVKKDTKATSKRTIRKGP